MNDKQVITLGFSDTIDSTYGYVERNPERKVSDEMVVKANMVIAPQYIQEDDGIRIIGWGLIPAPNAVRLKDA